MRRVPKKGYIVIPAYCPEHCRKRNGQPGEIEGERYEYETNVLLAAAKKHLPFAEVPVQTVYLDGNRSSHFGIVADSLHIYWNSGKRK